MVYDWFNRAPANAESPAPASEDVTPQVESELAAEPPAAAPPDALSASEESGPDPAAVDLDSLAWAKAAYARLKAQQEAAMAQPEAPEPPQSEAPEPPSPAPAGLSLLEQAAAQRAERLQALVEATPVEEPEPAPAVDQPSADEPQLGAFDETFTWSAEVLAAQGKRVEQISLEEIDWLGRLRRGLDDDEAAVFGHQRVAPAHHRAARQEHAERAALGVGGVEAALLPHVPVEFDGGGALEQHAREAPGAGDELVDGQHGARV